MTTHRDLTTPEEVLAALRAGGVVEVRRDTGWEPTVFDANDGSLIVAAIANGRRYRAVNCPRTFTAAEVAEAFAGLEAKWRASAVLIRRSDEDYAAEWVEACADELHERITHWLRENEG
jgi:hypothetical protein